MRDAGNDLYAREIEAAARDAVGDFRYLTGKTAVKIRDLLK